MVPKHPLQQPKIVAGISSADTIERSMGTLPPGSLASNVTIFANLRVIELSDGCTRMTRFEMLLATTSNACDLAQKLPHWKMIEKAVDDFLAPRSVKFAIPL